jgi:hypothetical protein
MGPAGAVHGRSTEYGLERCGTVVPGSTRIGPMSHRTRIVPISLRGSELAKPWSANARSNLSCVQKPDETTTMTAEGDARNVT